MKLSRFILFVIFALPSLSFAQEMSKAEMVDDFNQLISIINNYYRAKPLVELRSHTNISKELNLLKEI